MKREESIRHAVIVMVKKSLNELRGDIPIVPQSGGRCDSNRDCPKNGTCYGNKCRYPAPRPSNN